jgi:hypothetical protein
MCLIPSILMKRYHSFGGNGLPLGGTRDLIGSCNTSEEAITLITSKEFGWGTVYDSEQGETVYEHNLSKRPYAITLLTSEDVKQKVAFGTSREEAIGKVVIDHFDTPSDAYILSILVNDGDPTREEEARSYPCDEKLDEAFLTEQAEIQAARDMRAIERYRNVTDAFQGAFTEGKAYSPEESTKCEADRGKSMEVTDEDLARFGGTVAQDVVRG